MKLFTSALVSFYLARAVYSAGDDACSPNQTVDPSGVCNDLKSKYPNITFFPGDANYDTNNKAYWSSDDALGPACVFQPSTPEVMGEAVAALASAQTLFAIRGGGHMPIQGFANINSTGVLLSSNGFKQLQVSDDKSTVNVGPGNRWNNVYNYLESYGLSVVGGRLGVVGVPGYLTGGGVSFFGNEFGWASANFASITAVLADGKVVTATADNEYSDLLWALRGGGNSFAIVTNFELRALAIPKVMIGTSQYGNTTEVGDEFLENVYSYCFDGANDAKSALIPLIDYGTPTVTGPSYSAYRFYNDENASPQPFENFTAPNFAPYEDTFTYRSMGDWVTEQDPTLTALSGNARQRFHVRPFKANLEAMQIVRDTWVQTASEQLSAVDGLFYYFGLAMMPVPASFFENSIARGGPDPQGQTGAGAPWIWVEESVTWLSPDNDEVMLNFIENVTTTIDAKFVAAGVESDPFLYINDANEDQPVWEGYPAENVQRLQSIREKYDPSRVFTDLMPGGWKVAYADPAKSQR